MHSSHSDLNLTPSHDPPDRAIACLLGPSPSSILCCKMPACANSQIAYHPPLLESSSTNLLFFEILISSYSSVSSSLTSADRPFLPPLFKRAFSSGAKGPCPQWCCLVYCLLSTWMRAVGQLTSYVSCPLAPTVVEAEMGAQDMLSMNTFFTNCSACC